MISEILEIKNYQSILQEYKKCRKYSQIIQLKNEFLIQF